MTVQSGAEEICRPGSKVRFQISFGNSISRTHGRIGCLVVTAQVFHALARNSHVLCELCYDPLRKH
jgi:hypothetical protein